MKDGSAPGDNETANEERADSRTPDLVTEATVEAELGASTITHRDEATDRVSHPDLAQGESD